MSNFKSNKTDGSESLFGEVIFQLHPRAQAIADRALIDVTSTAVEAGFSFPTAVTGNLMAAIGPKSSWLRKHTVAVVPSIARETDPKHKNSDTSVGY